LKSKKLLNITHLGDMNIFVFGYYEISDQHRGWWE